MNKRFLGTLALIGAPFLLIGHTLESWYPELAGGRFYGVYGFIYITGWMCSMELLRRAHITGNSRFGKSLLWVVLGSLLLANISNIYAFISPADRSPLMLILDSFWPLSNLLMLVVAITVLATKGISGWRRFVPLFVGLWLPFTLSTRVWLSSVHIPFNIVSTYSAIAWTLLAIVAITLPSAPEQKRVRQFQVS